MQNEEIINKINQLLIEEIEIDENQVAPSAELKKDLPDLPFIFISSHKKLGLNRLTNLLWNELNRING